jgi:hypothetical protein
LLIRIRPPLLCAQRLEGHVLQAPDFRLQQPQVHESRATVVVARRLLGAGAADREDRDPTPVCAAHLDPAKLAATQESEGSKEEVVRL